jgi:hypothetical protein
MTRLLLNLLAISALALPLAAHADGHFDRTLTAGAAPDVYVSTGSGNIRIHPSSGNQIEIHANVRGGWGFSHDVDERIRRIVANPPLVQSGNSVHIGESDDHELFHQITIDYDIDVPANAALNLRSGSGDEEIDNVSRYLKANSGSGNVRAHQIHGPAELATGSGDIELEQQGAGNVSARSGSGSVRLHGVTGALEVRTGSGDIEAEVTLTGPAKLQSGSGNIRLHIQQNAHFNLEASTGSGDIHVNFPGAPQQSDHSQHHLTGPVNGGGAPIEVRTGSGNIEISPR